MGSYEPYIQPSGNLFTQEQQVFEYLKIIMASGPSKLRRILPDIELLPEQLSWETSGRQSCAPSVSVNFCLYP